MIMKKMLLISFTLFVVLNITCNKQACTDENKYAIKGTQLRQGDDPYLTALYWKINDSPMQQKLRNIKPFPVGVVYYQQQGDNLDSAKKEFAIIRKLGFTALKQVQLKAPYNNPDFEEQVFNAALNAGITPWYYGKGGWARITQELVDTLGINMKVCPENMEAIQSHPAMIRYQTEEIMRPRIAKNAEKNKKLKEFLEARKTEKGEPGRNNPWIPDRLIDPFAKWLEKNYGTIDNLKAAWNDGFIKKWNIVTWKDAAIIMKGEGFDKFGNGVGTLHHDFRCFRDAMRFQADLVVQNYVDLMYFQNQYDSIEPERTGGHQLFENQAANGWDIEGQARAASIGGSFYSSIHQAHHFFLVNGEITKPVYLQARIIADMFKGGWAATWESTGGPNNHSGYFPYTVDGNRIKQMMLSYIAAGLKGIGIWMWNARGEGWEVGEYALCNNQGKPSERAIVSGAISKVLQHQRFELWEALDEPIVGILDSWENDAILGRLSLGAYPLNTYVFQTEWDKQFRQYHSQAKIGLARALLNNNIPFEYVTERNIAEGLAARYPIIYLPYVIALDESTLDQLMQYVENGGRLVADCPVLMMDNYGRLNKQHVGSKFERLFGFQVADYYHTFNAPKTIDGVCIKSYFGNINITHAKVLASMHDGTPAVLSASYGKGTVLMFNFEASRSVFAPGNTKMENFLCWYTLGNIRPPFEVSGNKNCFVLRRSAPAADHYFVINEGEKETIKISSSVINYETATDVLTGEKTAIVANAIKVSVPAHSAVWLRCEK